MSSMARYSDLRSATARGCEPASGRSTRRSRCPPPFAGVVREPRFTSQAATAEMVNRETGCCDKQLWFPLRCLLKCGEVRSGALKPVPNPVPTSQPVAHSDYGSTRKSSDMQSVADGAAQESNLPSDGLRRLTGFEDRLGHRARAAPPANVAQPDLALRRSTRSSPTRRVRPSASKRSSRSCACLRPPPVRSRKRARVIELSRSHSSTTRRFASA
jgi:hypothetical protein